MLKKPREGKGIPTFAKKKLGPLPTTPPQPKRLRTNRQPESGGFSRIIIVLIVPYLLANPHSLLFTRRFYIIVFQF